jgi:hypothetical protein
MDYQLFTKTYKQEKKLYKKRNDTKYSNAYKKIKTQVQ